MSAGGISFYLIISVSGFVDDDFYPTGNMGILCNNVTGNLSCLLYPDISVISSARSGSVTVMCFSHQTFCQSRCSSHNKRIEQSCEI